MSFTPTDEQVDARDLYLSGETMVIEAGAGTGKTSTLVLLAEADRNRRGQYLAFNKAIVTEAERKFPSNVAANTVHSLAFRSHGKAFAKRLRAGGRLKGYQIADLLGLDKFSIRFGSQTKTLDRGYLGGYVMRGLTRFCQTADEIPTVRHFEYVDGIDLPALDGKRTYDNNNALRDACVDALLAAWADVQRVDGRLPFKHEHYLKQWQLSHPRIDTDVIFFDEAQDANPIMAAVVAEQTHAQRVYVGDSQQAIYEFTGAVNAMAEISADARRFLTQSFRFGPAVAQEANAVLGMLDTPLRLSGTPEIGSVVRSIDDPQAVLCRTNARAMQQVFSALDEGRKSHLVGGGKEIAAFAEAARDLMTKGSTWHPELRCFGSWEEVQTYVEHDPDGEDLKMLVTLVDGHGPDEIIRALGSQVRESEADVVISTAHKAKGREWASVRIEDDFAPADKMGPADYRLLYVAVTRAQQALDVSLVADRYSTAAKKAQRERALLAV